MHNDTAIIWGTRRITWGQMDAYCAHAQGQLKTFGFNVGDRVAICAPTSPEYLIVVFALWRMGVVVCPINPKLPVQSISAYLSSIHAVLFLTSAQIKLTHPGISVRTLILNEVVNFDARHGFNDEIKSWQPRDEQEVTIIATSGSSGQPKPAVHTWGNHRLSAEGSHSIIPLAVGDRWLLCLPLYHIAGIAILVRVMMARAAIVLPVEDNLSQTILKRQVTHVSLVSTQMFRLLSSSIGIEALRAVRHILLGGSAIPATCIDLVKSHGLNVHVSYGLTEMSSQVATGKVGEGVKVLKYRDIKISPQGQILVKGPTLFKGYIQGGRIHLPLQDGGWFDTGDLGQLNEQGYLTVLGRKDNMFISGGENVHPEEIERVLLSIPGVVQAMVIPKEDAEFGLRPVAFIEYAKEALVSSEEIIRYAKEHLPKYKIPIAFLPWLPDISETGIKPSRKELYNRLNPA